MSLHHRHFLTRGASVLAALVVAAVLASAGLLLQETGPLAFIENDLQSPQAQAANGAITQQSQGAPETKEECDYRYDYEFTIDKDGSLKETRKPFCATNASACHTKNGEVVPKDEQRKSSIVAESKAGTKVNLQCDKNSPKNDIAKQAVATAGFHDLEQKVISASDLAESLDKLGVEPIGEERTQLADALNAQQGEIEQKVEKANQDWQTADKALEKLGGENAAELCVSGPYATSGECQGVLAAQNNKLKAEGELQKLTDQYAKLNEQKVALSGANAASLPANCPPGSSDCSNLAAPTDGQKPPPGGQLPPDRTGQQPPGRTNTFAPPGAGQGVPSMPKGGGSGGGSSGGGSGGGQQQQCQPQYFCNGNTLMHAQCYNQQPGNAQQIQQCPTGYACQENACQPSAQYGYCADGRTPRTAPAQPQPAASTCTVGAWEDASNGCQTSWRCTPKGSGSGQPTAQLSCQPTAASAGATINITYACANGATTASSTGFSIASETTLSGTASATAQKPASGQTTTYALTCTNTSTTPVLSASEQCTVRVATPTIVLVATPEKISQAEADEEKRKSTIGWVTSGMQKCAISSPDFATWSEQQASNTSVAGAAISPIIPPTGAQFNLACTTLGGMIATSTVRVISTP